MVAGFRTDINTIVDSIMERDERIKAQDDRIKALEAEIVDIKRVCPCWLSRLREREPTKMEVELKRLERKKRTGEK